MIVLQKGFRQNDRTFLTLLNEIRKGNVSATTDATLNNKVSQYHSLIHAEHNKHDSTLLYMLKPKIVRTKLYPTNKNVDEHNNEELKKIMGKSYFYESTDIGQERFRSQFDSFRAPKILELKVGCQV